MKPLASKKILIRGEKWQIGVLQDECFNDQYGENCAGITLLEKKKIEIPLRDLSFVTVLHEVFHAYASYLHLASADIQGHQSEEIFAELFSSYGVQMINTTKSLVAHFSKKLSLEPTLLVASLSEDQRKFALPEKPLRRRHKKA